MARRGDPLVHTSGMSSAPKGRSIHRSFAMEAVALETRPNIATAATSPANMSLRLNIIKGENLADAALGALVTALFFVSPSTPSVSSSISVSAAPVPEASCRDDTGQCVSAGHAL
eukprot:CAMPEP_0179492668 /NCGR_PEP_ID=MMETSP0799-20121207/66920_1 /TAXON_ID=46947 /ORGANISM="Geminigera cryophila, Strain CCMP2564" /LENGTH=114 /DNA_ID=CAMNT_0021309553 /DNA_START=305 /DNA_END=650 /DNA_ORIENTATION=-